MSHYNEQIEEHGNLPRYKWDNTAPTPMFQHCNDTYTEVVDLVNHPSHYKSHKSGVECIEIIKHMNFCLGNVVKYVWRADLKGDGIEDLKKAAKYIQFEIDRRQNNANVEE